MSPPPSESSSSPPIHSPSSQSHESAIPNTNTNPNTNHPIPFLSSDYIHDAMVHKPYTSTLLGMFVEIFMVRLVQAILPITIFSVLYRAINFDYWSIFQHGLSEYFTLLNLHCVLEISFAIIYYHHKNMLCNLPLDTTMKSYTYDHDVQKNSDPMTAFEKSLDDFELSFVDKEDFEVRRNALCTWFIKVDGAINSEGKVNWNDLRNGDVESWLDWAYFTPTSLSETDKAKTLNKMIQRLERWCNSSPLPIGTNNKIKPLRLNLDEINATYHPYMHYVVTHCIANLIGWNILLSLGFQRKVVTTSGGSMVYYKHRSSTDCVNQKPVLFASGIGIGLVSYISFIKHLLFNNESEGREILLFDLPEFSLRFAGFRGVKILSPDTVAQCVEKILGGRGCDAIGHSFGTIIINWILRLTPPDTICTATLIDPVTFLLINSSVAFNFCYTAPVTPLDRLVKYFVAEELYVNNALMRHFRWEMNMLCVNDILERGVKCCIVLSEFDSFVPSSDVGRYVDNSIKRYEEKKKGGRSSNETIKSILLENHAHAQFFVNTESIGRVIEGVNWVMEK